MIILGTNTYSGDALKIVTDEVPAGFEYRMLTEASEECLLSAVGEADYLLAGGRVKLTERVLGAAKRLKMIQRSGVGLDTLDLEAIKARGIPLYVNQGVNAQSVAEHTLLLILACLRRLPTVSAQTKAGVWKKQEQGVRTAELKGKTVGIIGMGHIARTLAELLKPFGVTILYSDLRPMPEAYESAHNMRFTDRKALLEQADVLTLHCALTPETRHMIDRDALRGMKRGAILVNTARGELVDAQALSEALKEGALSYAALDVHDPEPIAADNPLKAVENVILTPHIAGVTRDSFRTMMHDAFRNIARFDEGRLDEIAPYRYL